MGTVHIIGAGLAGLSTAVRLANAKIPVRIYESAGQAGGRCRSYVDKTLGTLIDNGNHLIMSGNRSALSFLDLIGSRDSMIEPSVAAYPFVDLETDERWILRPNEGVIPWWVASKKRRVPNTKLSDYFEGLKVPFASRHKTVAEVVKTSGPLYKRFWEPLTLAALNTTADDGAACLLWPVLKETFLKGETACRPLIAREGLGPSFIEPALAFLKERGTVPEFSKRLTGLSIDAGWVTGLTFDQGEEVLKPGDQVVLAVPSVGAGKLLPELDTPGEGGVIVNAHYLVEDAVPSPGEAPFIGVVGSPVHWIFVRENIISLTISAAGPLADESADELAPKLWKDTAAALKLGDRPYKAARIIKEKRATFDQSPAGIAKRRGPHTAYSNLVLAGDWTNTHLPATIESAIRSGENAAKVVMSGD